MLSWKKSIRLLRFYEALEEMPLLQVIRQGFTYMIPMILIGSLAMMVLSLPIPAYQRFMSTAFGTDWGLILDHIQTGTNGILSILLVICISYSYILTYSKSKFIMSPIIGSSVSVGSYFAFCGILDNGFSSNIFSTMGAFCAILLALASSALFFKLCSIKKLQFRAFTDGINAAAFQDALNAIFPAAITVSAFAALHELLRVLFGISSLQEAMVNSIIKLFANLHSPLSIAIFYVLLIHALWFIGLNGRNMLETIARGVLAAALTSNQIYHSMGILPAYAFTEPFFDHFVFLGGCGASLCLIAAVFIAGRHKNLRRFAKLSSLPTLFNINDLVIFGIPIVFNPVYFIPFLCVPLLLTATSYLAIYAGLVPYTIHYVTWTTPIFLSGYLTTQSLSGSFLQLFNLILGTLCYIPFVKLAEKVTDAQIKSNFKKAYSTFRQMEHSGDVSNLLSRSDKIGTIARFLAADLEHDLNHNRLELYYQPQVDYEGNVEGVEALLRWNHENYGYIYPPFIISLAEEAGFIDNLGRWIFDQACETLKQLHQEGFDQIVMSANVSAVQLENPAFAAMLMELAEKHKVSPSLLKIEITERLAISSNKTIMEQIHALKRAGFKLAMDDFGMGHSSLMYLKEYDFDTIKLDGALVREILFNNTCRDIVHSIASLGKMLHYSVTAEYVDQEEQRQVLHSLGCDHYQGHLFCKAVPYDKLNGYMRSQADARQYPLPMA